MTTVRWIGFSGGLVIVLWTVSSVVRSLIVPRGLASSLSAVVSRVVKAGFHGVSNRFDDYEAKDRILAFQAPTFVVAQLLTWLVLLFLGFALMLWPFIHNSFGTALVESGSSMLTLGFAATPGVGATAVHLVAAMTGLGVVALQIGYLPTLYGAFNRRETLVTMLQSRGGAPAWGVEILIRHQTVGLLEELPALYAQWERWAADVAESHTNYPILMWFRSPHPLRSWLLGIGAVMDAAAIDLASRPDSAPTEARLCLRMGFLCLRDIAVVLKIPFDPDPLPDDPIELTYEEFHAGYERLETVGFPLERGAEEAWPHFRGWRVNYEALFYAVADRVVAPPGPWSGPRHHLPGMQIIPQRPADRRPDDHKAEARPKGSGLGW